MQIQRSGLLGLSAGVALRGTDTPTAAAAILTGQLDHIRD